jgi:two-component system response regulator FixJ
MPARNTVCVVAQGAALSNALNGLFKSGGLNLVNHSSAKDIFAALDPDKPVGCVVAEVTGGLDVLGELAAHHCVVPVVLLADSNNLGAAVQAIKAGAFDVVEKPDFLLESAKRALAFYVKCQKLLEEKTLAGKRIGSLTRREEQVLNLMVAGLPNGKIAEQLGISPKTMDIHRANLMDKMGARTTADLCRAHLLHSTKPIHLQYLIGS